MHIDAIKKTKSGKYKITIDDEVITTYDDVLLKNNLLYKKDIDDNVYKQIMEDNAYYDAYNKALNHLLRRNRSVREMKEYLERFDLSQHEKDKIIAHLKEIGLLNNQNYARAYISDAIYLRSEGPDKIKSSLRSEEIPEDIIEEEVAKIDDDVVKENAEKLINKKVKGNHHTSAYQLKQKIVLDMVNLGYSRDLVLSILDNIDISDMDTLALEYDKLYAKLSHKHQGNDLYNKIKQKLYAKGFDINAINNYVNQKREF